MKQSVIYIHEDPRDIQILLDAGDQPAVRYDNEPSNTRPDLIVSLTAITDRGETIALPVDIIAKALEEPGLVITIDRKRYGLTELGPADPYND